MHQNEKREAGKLRWFHWGIIVLSSALTLFAWYFSSEQVTTRAESAFNRQAKQVISLVNERMQKYEDALWAGAAYISAVQHRLTYKDWAAYASSLSLEKKYPGINGIGVIYFVSKYDLKLFEKQEQKLRKNFKIYPAHQNGRSMPIVFIEPKKANLAAIGLDIAHEQNRFNAALETERTGLPHITAPIILVQDQERTPGFLLFVPLYNKAERIPANMYGMVYAPFIMKKLIHGVLALQNREVALKISENQEILYNELNSPESQARQPKYQLTFSQPMYGRVWQYHISSTPKFENHNANAQPYVILFSGIVIDFLLIYFFITLSRYNQKADAYAKILTQDLRKQTKELQQIAHYDQLTHLPNRNSFIRRLSHSLEKMKAKNTGVLVVCFLGFDNFKHINDTLGYQVGDGLLKYLPKLLKLRQYPGFYAARLSGDEFGLLIEGEYKLEEIKKVLKGYLDSANNPIKIQGNELFFTLSIGVALYPSAGTTAEQLIVNADVAMHTAKITGKNSLRFFDENISNAIKRRHNLDHLMRQAIKNAEFTLAYQPQIDLKTQKIVGFESLMRWQDDIFGVIPPNEFIALAEENKLIIQLGRWAIKQICEDMKALESMTNCSSFSMSVNASAIELEDPTYVDFLIETLKTYGIDLSRITVELTESVLSKNPEMIIEVTRTLIQSGIQIGLDDFGTGYSSMQYLKQFDVSILKIDQHFMRDLFDSPIHQTIVRSIIALGHDLGIKVIAEGVETKEQLDFLSEHHCDLVQGYYHYKPLPLSALLALPLKDSL